MSLRNWDGQIPPPDARLLRRGPLDNGYAELPVTSTHAVALDLLPPLHKARSTAC